MKGGETHAQLRCNALANALESFRPQHKATRETLQSHPFINKECDVSIDSQDRALSLAMRRVLSYAKDQMPGSILCIISFTECDNAPGTSLQKIACNVEHREELIIQAKAVLDNFGTAPVIDLTDTEGGVQ
jgi:hypothetical protein